MKTSVCRFTKLIWLSAVMSVALLLVSGLAAWSVTYLSGPATLSRGGETYVLNRDFSCSGTAFTITAANVVLDLGGYTVTYGTGNSANSYGVEIAGANAEVKNGTLAQSASNDAKYCHGVYVRYVTNTSGPRIHDLTVSNHSMASEGIRLVDSGSGCQIYNNTLNTSNVVEDIDTGVAAINLSESDYGTPATPAVVRNNTISGSQVGIWLNKVSYVNVYANQIHHYAPIVNAKASYAVRTLEIDHCLIHDNVISTSRGMGIVLQAGSNDNQVYNNTLDLSEDVDGEWHDVQGLRLRHGGVRNKIYGNTVVVRGVNGNHVINAFRMGDDPDSNTYYGTPDNNEIYGNTFDMRYSQTMSPDRVCVTFNAVGRGNVFRDNICISNGYIIGAALPGAGPMVLQSNTFRKGSSPASGWRTSDMWGGAGPLIVVDGRFANGASATDVHFGQPGGSMSIQWYLTIKVQNQNGQPVSGADISVRDRTGTVVFTGTTATDGSVRPALQQMTKSDSGDTVFTPHTVTASKAGYTTSTTSVTVDASKEVTMSVTGSSGVSFTTQADRASASPGEIITYTLTYVNNTGATMTLAVIESTIDENTTFVAGSAKLNGTPISPDPVQGGKLVVSLGELAAGATGTLTFQVQVK
jgi:uncharacterized repeat protein (TIGR01451 family)